jgi:Kef-type K+ transport system membrane component KefB
MRFMIIVRASRAIVPYLLERWLGLNGDTARRIGPVLSQGGEFAFVLFAMGVIQIVIGDLVNLAVTLSMAAQSLALFIDEAISRASTPEPPESHHSWGFEALGGPQRT